MFWQSRKLYGRRLLQRDGRDPSSGPTTFSPREKEVPASSSAAPLSKRASFAEGRGEIFYTRAHYTLVAPRTLGEGRHEVGEEVRLRCHPERSEGPQPSGFQVTTGRPSSALPHQQATTGVLRRRCLLRMTACDLFPQPGSPQGGHLACSERPQGSVKVPELPANDLRNNAGELWSAADCRRFRCRKLASGGWTPASWPKAKREQAPALHNGGTLTACCARPFYS